MANNHKSSYQESIDNHLISSGIWLGELQGQMSDAICRNCLFGQEYTDASTTCKVNHIPEEKTSHDWCAEGCWVIVVQGESQLSLDVLNKRDIVAAKLKNPLISFAIVKL